MTLPCDPNPINLQNIETEFSGTHPISLNEYYGVASGIPQSGPISMGDFRCRASEYSFIVFNSPGSWKFTPPANVDVLFEVLGAGGGGGGGNLGSWGIAAGGASGAYAKISQKPVSYLTATISVGAGGAAGGYGTTGGTGGSTSVTYNGTTWTATGGGGGGGNSTGYAIGAGGVAPALSADVLISRNGASSIAMSLVADGSSNGANSYLGTGGARGRWPGAVGSCGFVTGGGGGIGAGGGGGCGSNNFGCSGLGGLGGPGFTKISIKSKSAIYSSPGTFYFRVPENVSSLKVVVTGGGGGGGGGGNDNTAMSGADGGKGESIVQNISVTPRKDFVVVVGAGGGPGINGSVVGGGQGGAGGAVNGVSGTSTYNAGGGGGGGGASAFLESYTTRSSGILITANGGGGGAGADNITSGSRTYGRDGGAGGSYNTVGGGGAGGKRFNGSSTAIQEYTVPGTYTYTVPAGVTSIEVLVIGGGGGGGSGFAGGGGGSGGQGGGSGGYLTSTISVTAGQTFTVVVGSGGAGAAVNAGGGSAGAASKFGTVIAGGGYAGYGWLESSHNNQFPTNYGQGGSPNGVAAGPVPAGPALGGSGKGGNGGGLPGYGSGGTSGLPGTGYGSGGGGGARTGYGTVSGGAGSAGYVKVFMKGSGLSTYQGADGGVSVSNTYGLGGTGGGWGMPGATGKSGCVELYWS